MSSDSVPSAPIRVLVVDDSRLMQRALSTILEAAGMKIVGVCGNGREAIELNKMHRPDVITMDIKMPRMDGLEAMAAIMSTQPTPIVIVSSYSRSTGVEAAKALALGAIDIVAKPSGEGIDLDIADVAEELTLKVRAAARVRVVRTIQGQVQPTSVVQRTPSMPSAPRPSVPETTNRGEVRTDPIVLIGASTGGPQVLVPLLSALPTTLACPVLLVVHAPAQFTNDLLGVLARKAAIKVVQASDGARAEAGVVYLAPGDHHLELSAHRRLRLTQAPRVNFHRPSVDVLFSSAAHHAGADALGIVLTGMGSDGTRGALDLKAAGATIITQDEATSVVYGMPKAVVEAGASDKSLNPLSIVEEIKRWSVRKGSTP